MQIQQETHSWLSGASLEPKQALTFVSSAPTPGAPLFLACRSRTNLHAVSAGKVLYRPGNLSGMQINGTRLMAKMCSRLAQTAPLWQRAVARVAESS